MRAVWVEETGLSIRGAAAFNEPMLKETKDVLSNEAFLDLATRWNVLPMKAGGNARVARSKAIGEIVMNFQLMENQIIELILFLAQIPSRTGGILVNKLSFKALLETARALCADLNTKYKDDLLVALGAAQKCEEIRNRIVHSVWTSGPLFKKRICPKVGLNMLFEDFTDEEIQEVADHFGKVAGAIFQIWMEWLITEDAALKAAQVAYAAMNQNEICTTTDLIPSAQTLYFTISLNGGGVSSGNISS